MLHFIMDARVKPAHDTENVPRVAISDSLFKQPRAKLRRPVSLRRRVRRLLFLPSGYEGMARQGALP